MLKVRGDSMVNAAITDGDWVVVRQQERCGQRRHRRRCGRGNGSGATVKTLKRAGGHVWLIPHNPAYAPILGGVVAVLRRI